jgi:hypothetical protein
MKRDEIEKTEAINEDELTVSVEGEKVEEEKQKGREDHKEGGGIRYL